MDKAIIKNPLIITIQKIRTKNNTLWCKLLDIALEANPAETKQILKDIRRNDILISKHTGTLSE